MARGLFHASAGGAGFQPGSSRVHGLQGPPAGTFTWDGGAEFYCGFGSDFAYAQDVSWRVTTVAKDLQGDALPQAQEFTFKVRRQVTAVLTADSTGAFDDVNVLSSGALFDFAGYLAAGDADTSGTSTPDLEVRALFSFNLGPPAVEATVLDVEAASLVLRNSNVPTGANPFAQSASIFVQAIDVAAPGGFAASYLGAYSATPVCTRAPANCTCAGQMVAASASFSAASSDVLTDVAAALGTRRLSYRLQRLTDPAKTGASPAQCPAAAVQSNNQHDFAMVNSTTANSEKPTLNVTYTAP